MMRKQASLINVIVTLILLSVLLPAPVQAHSITVDGDPSDWDPSGYAMDPPTTDDTGHIGRDSSSQGQYIWKDTTGDESTSGSDPDTNYDLTEFRVTAGSDDVYFLAEFSDVTDDVKPYLAIAVDSDQDGTGNLGDPDGSETSVSTDARWERWIVVNKNNTGYYTEGGSPAWTDAGSSSMSVTNDAIEVSMPRSGLGLTWPARMRFTVFIAENNNSTPQEQTGSDGLDALTNVANDLSDGDVDYYFDVWFNSSGEPYAPLLITGVLPNPTGDEPEEEEWGRVTNVSGQTIDLSNFKLGDEETKNQGEAMNKFNSGTMGNGSIIVARRASDFNTLCSFKPDYEFESTDASVPDMMDYDPWDAGLLRLVNADDEILLLDSQDTVIDAVSWGSGSYPGVNPYSGSAPSAQWLARSDTTDTNDTASDFSAQGSNCPAQPTLLELASFTATPHDGYVLVEWKTASEMDNAGFNVWRSETEAGSYTQLNAALIPAQGGPTTGASYSYDDDAVTNSVTYWYKLEDLDLYGVSTLHGPVSATPRQLHWLYLPLLLKGGYP
jgi:hypothetical protein